MKLICRIIFVAAIVIATTLIIWRHFSPEVSRVTLSPAAIANVKSMVQLSSVEVYEEVPVKGTVGKRHLVGRMALEGSVDFNLEQLDLQEQGDSLVLVLPPETVTLNESTRPGAYKVIDTWNDSFFGSGNISTAEENGFKEAARRQAVREMYSRGDVRRARAEAAASLKSLLGITFPGRTIVVTDPTPEGQFAE